ncbi:class I adenylate-forming enzyme family protein [Streptomyces xylophagus]|uniref:class I adenylate-forming enzyme family protein n=1 Tax=Streptomyces xylophagus TaxID=285514 RepID=UPI0005BE3DAF|nr:fatty acid--CoA ligase family protein [Streptomyces xylophagus]
MLPSTSAARVHEGANWTEPLIAPQTIGTHLRVAAQRYGDTCCLVEIDPMGREMARVGFRALMRLVTDRADRLRWNGTSGASHIGVPVTNTIASVVDILAVLESGAAAVIVDAAEPVGRREEQFTLLCDAIIEDTPADGPLRRNDPVLGDLGTDPYPTAFVLFTTGSTAASKPVAQSHYAVLVNVLATIRHHEMGQGQTMACALPISHVNGLHFGVLATLLSGGTCLLFQQFDPLTYLRALAAYGAQRATTVPSLLQSLCELRRWPTLPDLRYVVSAAAPLTARTVSLVYERGYRVVQGYGLSECMNFATTMPIDMLGPEYEKYVLGVGIPAVGHAVHGCEVAILSANGIPLGPGATGEVGIRGHSLMTGYLGDDTATDEALGSGWLKTGDIGCLEAAHPARGPWLTLVGRQKNVAKCNGLSVSLEEIDRWLEEHPGVREACAVARPDPRRGDAVTAYYVAATEGPPTDELVAHVQLRLDGHSIGLQIQQIDKIPRLRSGKIDRRSLAALL